MADIEALASRAGKAWTDSTTWHEALREAYLWLWPDRYYQQTGGGRQQQRSYYDHLFDPVGLQALADGANQIAEALHPWDVSWFRHAPRNDLSPDDKPAIAEFSDQLTRVCEALIGRSAFHNAAVGTHKEFLISAGFLHLDRHPADPTRVRAFGSPSYKWALEADQTGAVIGMYRRLEPRARELRIVFDPRARFSDEAQRAERDAPDARVEFMLCVHWEPRKRLWLSTCYEVSTKFETWEQEHRTCPVVCYRSGAAPGQPWTSGPGLACVPDVKVANKVVELLLRQASISVAGVWQADDDGVLNPRNVRIVPGAIIPKAVGSAGLTPLQSPGDFNLSQLVLEDLRVNVRRALYVTRIEEREMTALEFAGRKEQQLREMRGLYGQLRSEFAEPVLLRVADLAAEIGLLPESRLDEITQVMLIGPLAQNVASAEVERVSQIASAIAGIAGPEVLMGAVKLENFIPYVVDKLNGEKTLFRNKAELVQLGATVLQMAAQMMAPKIGGDGGQQPAPANQPAPVPAAA